MKDIELKLNKWMQEAIATNDTELLMDLGDINILEIDWIKP